ncbi:MAG: hypothetical protein Q8Q15_02035 [bacterium]|nr:hypothetical protein [bacterium]
MNLSFDSLFAFFSSISVWDVVKVFVSFALLLYVAFAAVVVRQAGLMTETLHDQLAVFVKTIAFVHLALAILIFFLALVIL